MCVCFFCFCSCLYLFFFVFFQFLNFFKDHDIGEPMRRTKEVGQGLDFSLACHFKRHGLGAK